MAKSRIATKMAKYAAGAKRNGGGPFGEIDRMLAAFPERKKRIRQEVRERFGSRAGPVYVRGSWWQCRFKGRLHRALTPEGLLERLAETAAAKPTEAPPRE